MKERLVAAVIVCGSVLAILCKPSKQFPLCRSGTGYDCDGSEPLGEEVPSFSSRYRAMEYDDAAMKLLMEMLLMQHNSLSEEDELSYEPEESEYLNSGIDTNQSFPTNEIFLHGIANTLPNNKSITTVISPELHGPVDQNDSNQDSQFLHHPNPIKSRDNFGDEFREKIISKTFEELTSIHEPEQLLRILDDDNRFDSIPPTHVERIFMRPAIKREIENSGKLMVATVRTTHLTPSDSSVSHKNMLSSKYKDTKRTSTFKGAHSILILPRLFDGFTETLPLNYREHFKMPTTKPKKKINSLEPVDRDQEGVRGEIQLEILNRPISAGKPIAKPPGVDVGAGCEYDGNATSCKPNNKKPINIIKVKIGQKPAKMTMTMSRTTTTERGIFGKPGIRFRNSNPSSVSISKPDGNLISALASIVDIDENDAEDSDEEKDENGEYSDEKEDVDEYPDTSDAGNRKNFTLSKEPPLPSSLTPTPTSTESDEDDDDDTSSDVISSIIEEVNALIRRQTA